MASVGYMQRDLVERRGWLSEAEFLDGVALGQTMPGPLAAQVVMWAGFLRKGWAGALATAAAFIAPSFLLVLAVAGAIAGAVVVLSPQTITDIPTAAIAAVSLGLLLWRKIPEPVLVALGAIAGILLH